MAGVYSGVPPVVISDDLFGSLLSLNIDGTCLLIKWKTCVCGELGRTPVMFTLDFKYLGFVVSSLNSLRIFEV